MLNRPFGFLCEVIRSRSSGRLSPCALWHKGFGVSDRSETCAETAELFRLYRCVRHLVSGKVAASFLSRGLRPSVRLPICASTARPSSRRMWQHAALEMRTGEQADTALHP